jgi:hypothetical protein
MKIRNILIGAAAATGLSLGMQVASADTICAGCEYVDGAVGTYIGQYNPDTFDNGTFNHTAIRIELGPDTPFNDFWVFDLDPAGTGSISADFTRYTAIRDFMGALWTDAGSTCGPATATACASVNPGMMLAQVGASNDRWEIIASGLTAGRYIIQVTGTTRTTGPSSYSGQLAFVPEPGTLVLLSLGLLGIGATARRRGL